MATTKDEQFKLMNPAEGFIVQRKERVKSGSRRTKNVPMRVRQVVAVTDVAAGETLTLAPGDAAVVSSSIRYSNQVESMISKGQLIATPV